MHYPSETPVGGSAPAIPVMPAKRLVSGVRVCRWLLAGPPDDRAHRLGVERFHGGGPDVAKGAKLQQHGGSGLVVGELDHRDLVVVAKGPQQQAELAAVLLDQAPGRPRLGLRCRGRC